MDCHGAGEGYTFNSLIPEDLDPACEYVVQEEWTEYTGFLEEGCDAALFVGMHAMAGTADGVLNHTVSGQAWQNLWFNGTQVGETGINAALCGTWGCPVLLVTGDEAACREGKELLGDGLTTVAVKQGIGQTSARMIVPARAPRADRGGREAGALRPQGRRALRPRQAVRGQGRVQAHDRREADALPARRRVPRRPHDRVAGRRLVDGLEAVLLRRPLASASRRRSPSCPASSGPPSHERVVAEPEVAQRVGPLGPIRGPEMLRREVVHRRPCLPARRARAPRSLSARIWCGGLRFQPPPSKNRRSNGASGGNSSCQSPCRTRTFGESAKSRAQAAARSSSTSTVTNDASGPDRGHDPRGADPRSCADLGELAVGRDAASAPSRRPTSRDRRALEAHAPSPAPQRGERARDLG